MITFEINAFHEAVELTKTSYDCIINNKIIGTFSIYKNHYLNNKQEICIEVFPEFRRKGYAKLIYKSFILKCKKLGFKNVNFYSVVTKNNVKSIYLHKSLIREIISFNVFRDDNDVIVYSFEGAE